MVGGLASTGGGGGGRQQRLLVYLLLVLVTLLLLDRLVFSNFLINSNSNNSQKLLTREEEEKATTAKAKEEDLQKRNLELSRRLHTFKSQLDRVEQRQIRDQEQQQRIRQQQRKDAARKVKLDDVGTSLPPQEPRDGDELTDNTNNDNGGGRRYEDEEGNDDLGADQREQHRRRQEEGGFGDNPEVDGRTIDKVALVVSKRLEDQMDDLSHRISTLEIRVSDLATAAPTSSAPADPNRQGTRNQLPSLAKAGEEGGVVSTAQRIAVLERQLLQLQQQADAVRSVGNATAPPDVGGSPSSSGLALQRQVQSIFEELRAVQLLTEHYLREQQQQQVNLLGAAGGGQGDSSNSTNNNNKNKNTTTTGRRDRRSPSSSSAPQSTFKSIYPAVKTCDIPCSGHGLSVNVPGITDGCRCVCVGGWQGDLCERAPRGYYQHVAAVALARGDDLGGADAAAVKMDIGPRAGQQQQQPGGDGVAVGSLRRNKNEQQLLTAVNYTAPRLVIPHWNEQLSVVSSLTSTEVQKRAQCKAAAKKYYLKRYKSEEFRTDKALQFFWFLARSSMMPQCSTSESQTVVIDVGAKVGEQFQYWEREFLNLTHCTKNNGGGARNAGKPNGRSDTLLIMVEPNPSNLAILRHRIEQWDKLGAATIPTTSEKDNNGAAVDGDGDDENKKPSQLVRKHPRSGRVIVRDAALSYYQGFAKFVVNLKQDSGRQKGNERGSLDLRNQENDPETVRTFETRVETLSSLLSSLPYGYLRANYTISALKIDAEGYDPAIIYGSSDVLSRTNIVIFECHKLWKSAGFKFKDVAEFFAKKGFNTFKIGFFYWIPVSPPHYWDDVYDETLQWSNCVAIKEGHSFSHMFSLPPPCE